MTVIAEFNNLLPMPAEIGAPGDKFPVVNTRYSVEVRRFMPGSIHILIENRAL